MSASGSAEDVWRLHGDVTGLRGLGRGSGEGNNKQVQLIHQTSSADWLLTVDTHLVKIETLGIVEVHKWFIAVKVCQLVSFLE